MALRVMLFNGDGVIQEAISVMLPSPSFRIYKVSATQKALRALRGTSRHAVVIIDFSLTNWQTSAQFIKAVAQEDYLIRQHAYILLLSTDETLSLQIGNAITILSPTLLAKPLLKESLLAAIRAAVQKFS
jgi:FixJ family two-component response regulator